MYFEQARHSVIEAVRRLEPRPQAETVDLDQAYGRILAEPLLAERDHPALARSLRDGYALQSKDVPGTLHIRGEVRAGDVAQPPISAGEALEIMTGAPVPAGADSVVMLEHVTRSGSLLVVDRTAEPGQFVNERGAEARRGSVLIERGVRLDGSHIAALAGTGRQQVAVTARPTVAILATGDEIVGIAEQPAAHQIRNSNSHMLAALVRAAGGAPFILPVAQDTREALLPLLLDGMNRDMLVVTGGVSAGRYDLVKPVLRELGAEFLFERVRIQPGQPTAFGIAKGKPVFGLPGNPGSSLMTFELFARPALELLAGLTEPVLPLLWARFAAPFRHKGGLTRFLPARLSDDGLRHVSWQGSSDVPALARANCLLVADHDREAWAIGDMIRVMMKP